MGHKRENILAHRPLTMKAFREAVQGSGEYCLKKRGDDLLVCSSWDAKGKNPYMTIKNGDVMRPYALFTRGQRKDIARRFSGLSF
jgi:hypothetical protein